MLGALLALLGAMTFGLNNAAVRRGVLTGSVVQVLAIGIPIGAVMFALGALLAGQLTRIGEFSTRALMLLALVGLIHFLFGRYCNYRSLQAVGANRSSAIQQWSLLVSLVLAVTLLDEELSVLKFLGVLLVLFSPALTMRVQAGRRPLLPKSVGAKVRDEPTRAVIPEFEPNIVQGYLFGALSAVGYGVTPVIIRAELEDSDLPLAAGFVSYAAAAIVVIVLIVPLKFSSVMTTDRRALPWFVLSGVAVFFSQAFRYMALSIAPVIVVATLMRMAVVFRVIFSWFINRDYESFERHVLIGIGLSLLGALALTVPADFIIDTLPLPGAVEDLLGWRWPTGGE